MQFTITISGESKELSEALLALRTVMDGHATIAQGSVQATVKPAETKKAVKEEKAVTKTEATTPAVDEAAAATEDADAVPPVDGDSLPIPSIVDLRAKAQEVGNKAGKEAIKNLLVKYDCRSISEVKEEQRVAFMIALEELGR